MDPSTSHSTTFSDLQKGNKEHLKLFQHDKAFKTTQTLLLLPSEICRKMKVVKAVAIVLGFMYRNPALFANAAGSMIQEEVQVPSVSIELRQTSKIILHIFYIVSYIWFNCSFLSGRIRHSKLGYNECKGNGKT